MDDQTNQPNWLPPTRFGETYPSDHVIAIIDDESQAQDAVDALIATGVPESGIHYGTGEGVLRNERVIDSHRGVLDRIGGLFPSDEKGIIDEYKRLAAAGEPGRHFFMIEAPTPEQRDRVRDVLKRHGGYQMYHFDKRTYTNL